MALLNKKNDFPLLKEVLSKGGFTKLAPYHVLSNKHKCKDYKACILQNGDTFGFITPQPLRAVGVLFSPMVSGWAGGRASGRASGRAGGWAGGMCGRREKVCPGCISETVRCRQLILGRDIDQEV